MSSAAVVNGALGVETIVTKREVKLYAINGLKPCMQFAAE